MRICICAQKFVPPLIGGVDVYAERLGRALMRQSHAVSVLALEPGGEGSDAHIESEPGVHAGMSVRRIHFPLENRPKDVFARAYDAGLGQTMGEVLDALDVELLIIMNFYYPTLALVEAAKQRGVRVVHVATDFVPVCRRSTFIRWDGEPCRVGESISSCSACFVSHRKLGRLASAALGILPERVLVDWARRSMRQGRLHPASLLRPYWKQVVLTDERLRLIAPLRKQIDLVLAPTQYAVDMLTANGFGRHQVHFLPFGVEDNTPLTRASHVPADHTRFLFVGRLQPYKGAHLLIEAFDQLTRPSDATLSVYGTPDGHEAYFEDLKVRMAGNPRIRYEGRIDPAGLAGAFANADFFVLPSLWHENAPLILLDAVQSRTPVIASRVGGVTDLVRDSENGLLFPMGDIRKLQSLLQTAIDQPRLRERLISRTGPGLVRIDDYVRTMMELCRAPEGERIPRDQEFSPAVGSVRP
jgi:glycosyltransferase involved in cell wall biosynthesis